MSQGTSSNQDSQDQRPAIIWLQWVGATAGASLGVTVLISASMLVGFSDAVLYWIALSLPFLTVGVAQQWVLHRMVRDAHVFRWILITIFFGPIGAVWGIASLGIAGLPTFESVSELILVGVILATIGPMPLTSLVLSIPQWRFLRRHFKAAGWWVAGTSLGVGVGTTLPLLSVLGYNLWELEEFFGPLNLSDYTNDPIVNSMIVAFFWILTAAGQGYVLGRLKPRNSTPEGGS